MGLFNEATGTNLGQLCTLDSSTVRDLIEERGCGGMTVTGLETDV